MQHKAVLANLGIGKVHKASMSCASKTCTDILMTICQHSIRAGAYLCQVHAMRHCSYTLQPQEGQAGLQHPFHDLHSFKKKEKYKASSLTQAGILAELRCS